MGTLDLLEDKLNLLPMKLWKYIENLLLDGQILQPKFAYANNERYARPIAHQNQRINWNDLFLEMYTTEILEKRKKKTSNLDKVSSYTELLQTQQIVKGFPTQKRSSDSLTL